MISVKLNNLMCGANCQSQIYSSKESFLPMTYQFFGANIYGLISDFGCGSWAMATCLGGRCDPIEGDIFLNDKKISDNELLKYSCFVGENTFDEINSKDDLLSAKACIEKALEISKLPYSVQEIKNLFGLSDERFERDLNYVSGEIWRISIAVGFALNREIFCYPWLNTHDVSAYLDISNIEELRKHNKIIIIPTCRASLKTSLKKSFDHVIDFHAYSKPYFNIHPEERKKLKKIKGW